MSAHSKADFETFVRTVAYRWAQELHSNLDDIDLYGERHWSRPYGWTFLSDTTTIGGGRQIGGSTPQNEMVVVYQGENPLHDKDVAKKVEYMNTYSSKSHWSVKGGVKGGWSKGSALPGWNIEVNFEAGGGKEETTTHSVRVEDNYTIPPRHKLKVTSMITSGVTKWIFDVDVIVKGGIALNFNPPVALGPNPNDKHHYWWTEIGNVVRCGQDGGYGPPFMDKAEKHHDFVIYRGQIELNNAKTLRITAKPEYFNWAGEPVLTSKAESKTHSGCSYIVPGITHPTSSSAAET